MKSILLSLAVLTTLTIQAQKKDSIQEGWVLKSIFGANGTQSSFVNWNAGGRNNVSVMGYINASAVYTNKKISWDNSMNVALGGLQYIGAGSGNASLQKTDDRIELSTNFGRKFKEFWYASTMATFRTQALDGYNYPNDTVIVSRFMAPGYLNFGLGLEHKPNKHFSAFIYPIAAKLTLVNDQVLADAGSFGVDPAEYNASTGELIKRGKRSRAEFGAYFKMKYNGNLAENINLVASIDLFSNYLDRPENIDVNSDVLFTFKINGWLSTSLNWTLLYDHDIDIVDAKGNVGPRTQFKSVLGMGISYTLKNTAK